MTEKLPTVVPYDEAKLRWETFEQSDPRFIYSRKNYQYVSKLVNLEGNVQLSIDRATQYFDGFSSWLIRAEGYQHLAQSLPRDSARLLAQSVHNFSRPLLEHAPGHSVSYKFESFEHEQGTKTYENVLQMLNWSIATIGNNDVIEQHLRFLEEQVPTDVLARYENYTEEDTKFAAQYYLEDFKSRIIPTLF